jgi:MYXO-CTERM domain-containing protein
VGCTSSSQCANPDPICAAGQTCQACASDADCPGKVCATAGSQHGGCVACTPANTTLCPTATPLCDPNTDACVACLSSADCADPLRPACDLTAHVCAPCAADLGSGLPLSCSTPAKPACQAQGSLAGQCTACSATNLVLCGGNFPACTTSGSCGCTLDADCGATDSGRVCDSTVCRDGCRGTEGNGCPAGVTCSSTDSQIGTCEPIAGADAGADGGIVLPMDGSLPDGALPDGALLDGSTSAEDASIAPADASRLGADGAVIVAADAGHYVLAGGCSCGTAGSPLVGLVFLAGVALVRRRRT